MMEKDLKQIKPTRKKSCNTTWVDLKAFEDRKDVVICQADKGGGLVVLSKENYYKEVNRLVEEHV